jgi:hypothetical protein
MKRQQKVRKVQGEIISAQEIFEKNDGVVKSYGIVIRYLSRNEKISMYNELRDINLAAESSSQGPQDYLQGGRHHYYASGRRKWRPLFDYYQAR